MASNQTKVDAARWRDTLLTLVAIASIVLVSWLATQPPRKAQAVPLAHFGVGEAFPEVPGLKLASSTPQSVFVLLRTTACAACETWTDVQNKLVSQLPTKAQVIVLSYDPLEEVRAYLAQRDLVPDQAISIHPSLVRVRRMPGVFVVDRNGVILDKWEGPIDQQAQRAILLSAQR